MHCFSCNTTLCFLNRFCLLATAQLKNQMTKKGSRRSDFSSARKKTSLEKGPDRMRTSWDNHQMGQKITRSASLALQHRFFFFRYSASRVPFENMYRYRYSCSTSRTGRMQTDILFRQPNGFPDVAVATGSPCPQTRGRPSA